MSEAAFFTHWEHGAEPVRVIHDPARNTRQYLVGDPRSPKVYKSFRKLARDLVGYDLGITHDRYFRQGKYSRRRPGGPGNTCDLLHIFRPVVKGVDLDKRGHEVAKLLQAACGASIRHYGYVFEDVLQEVYKGILVRNAGKCAHDPAKSSFGHYVTMVSQCVFANYHKREQRRQGREVCGLKDSGGTVVDVAQVAKQNPNRDRSLGHLETEESARDLLRFLESRDDGDRAEARLAREILPWVAKGFRRGEIADRLGVGPASVGRALNYLRDCTREWSAGG